MVYGWRSEPFLRYKTFYGEGGGTCPRETLVDRRSMTLHVSYHKEQEYIWFKGGELIRFCIKTSYPKILEQSIQ